MNPQPKPFTRAQLTAAPSQILREGRWANARVTRATVAGVDWTVKDFGSRSWWVRNLFGRWLLRRELRALRRLAGVEGVPAQPFRVDAHAIAARFVPGVTLDRAPREQMNEAFFLALESLFGQVHARGLVHLDSRGSSNLLVTPQGRPAVIDFQAALRTTLLPPPLRRALEAVDLGGVYKNWLRHAPEALDAGRRAFYERSTRLRRLWIGRGYFGVRKERQRGKKR
jgi:tRNA A-37 threonylcarbamoyl transferase component Bud32